MSKYTTEVRYICETNAGLLESAGFNSLNEVLNKCAPKIFNFDFPIFDENYRLPLEVQILRHFYTREICEETVGLWKLRLQTRLCDIMPYYNELYKTAILDFNPLYDVDLTTTHTKTNDGLTTGVSNKETENKTDRNDESTSTTNRSYDSETEDTETSAHWDLYSETPQGAVTGIENDQYLTNARKITDSNTGNNTKNDSEQTKTDYTDKETINNSSSDTTNTSNKIENTEEYIQHVIGKSAGKSYASLVKEFRENIVNINLMIINELNDLFFGLW